MILSILGLGCAPASESDLTYVDDYLVAWDRFGQGENSLVPRLKAERGEFESQLARAVESGDRRAPGRVVFYAVVQVGGFVPTDSPIGEAFRKRFGDAVAPYKDEKTGSESYFAGDLYFWWESHKSQFAPYPLYEEWRSRDFAQTVAIPMYQGARNQSR
jgi:hypothetical protein